MYEVKGNSEISNLILNCPGAIGKTDLCYPLYLSVAAIRSVQEMW